MLPPEIINELKRLLEKIESLETANVSLNLQLKRIREDFDGLSSQKGPQGEQGPQGKQGVGMDGKHGPQGITGPTGPKGADGIAGRDGKDVDFDAIKASVKEWLDNAGFVVVFEAGDEPSESEKRIEVKFNNGELRIPPMILRIRNVNKEGSQIGKPLFDTAPLGSPLKLKFKPPVKVSQ